MPPASRTRIQGGGKGHLEGRRGIPGISSRYPCFPSGVFMQVLARDAAGRGGLSYCSPCA